MHSNHKKTKGLVKPGGSGAEITSWESIIPDEETLHTLEKYAPCSTKEWMAIAKQEIECRQKNESKVVGAYRFSAISGQIFSFLLSIGVLGIAGYCIHLDKSIEGLSLIFVTIGGIVWSYRRHSSKE